jgi:DNA repair exonuclease SbcCD ATPase subunit
MKNTPSSPERQKLRDAIEKQHAAQATLDEAKVARANAQDRWSAANEKIGEIEKEIADLEEQAEHSSDDLISSLASGADLAVLDRPKGRIDELRSRLAEAEHRSQQWSTALRAAEEAIEARQRAVEQAAFFTESAARAVMSAEVNAAAMLCNLESARNMVLDLQAKLSAIANTMDHQSEQRKAIDRVVNDTAWLADSHEVRRDRPAAQSIRSMFDALKQNADAKLEI